LCAWAGRTASAPRPGPQGQPCSVADSSAGHGSPSGWTRSKRQVVAVSQGWRVPLLPGRMVAHSPVSTLRSLLGTPSSVGTNHCCGKTHGYTISLFGRSRSRHLRSRSELVRSTRVAWPGRSFSTRQRVHGAEDGGHPAQRDVAGARCEAAAGGEVADHVDAVVQRVGGRGQRGGTGERAGQREQQGTDTLHGGTLQGR